jgi:hypothetical protein
MVSSAHWREVEPMDPIAQARELLAQLDDDEADSVGAFAPRDPDVALRAERFMQRSAELRQPAPAAATAAPPAVQPDAFTLRREWLADINGTVEVIAEETALADKTLEKKLREEFQAELGTLRAELGVLRGQLMAANEIAELRRQIEILRNDRVIDLPAFRKAGA